MKRTSFIAAFINNAATAILTDPNVTSEKVFKAAEHYADLAAERGIIEDEIDRNKVVDDIMAQIPAIVSKTDNLSQDILVQILTVITDQKKTIVIDAIKRAFVTGIIKKVYKDKSMKFTIELA